MPSEAEWEYAARGNKSTKYWWGDTASHVNANYGKDECCDGLAQGKDQWEKTAPVAQFQANPFGLYDMNGNVREWVQDCFHDTYNGAPMDGSAWTTACSNDSRVLRGGSWYDVPASLRSAFRIWGAPDIRFLINGFRLVRTLLTP